MSGSTPALGGDPSRGRLGHMVASLERKTKPVRPAGRVVCTAHPTRGPGARNKANCGPGPQDCGSKDRCLQRLTAAILWNKANWGGGPESGDCGREATAGALCETKPICPAGRGERGWSPCRAKQSQFVGRTSPFARSRAGTHDPRKKRLAASPRTRMRNKANPAEAGCGGSLLQERSYAQFSGRAKQSQLVPPDRGERRCSPPRRAKQSQIREEGSMRLECAAEYRAHPLARLHGIKACGAKPVLL